MIKAIYRMKGLLKFTVSESPLPHGIETMAAETDNISHFKPHSGSREIEPEMVPGF